MCRPYSSAGGRDGEKEVRTTIVHLQEFRRNRRDVPIARPAYGFLDKTDDEGISLKMFKQEITRDKYILLVLAIILLWAWIHTRADLIATLLTTTVGALLALTRSTPATQISAGADINVQKEKAV